jgi:hypothetical protein
MPPEPLCLRQGYQCTCSQCQIWIDQWSKELDAFTVVDVMMRDGKNLFQIYEWLRASQPDILRTHHAYIEGEYIVFKMHQGRKLKKTANTQTQDTTD